MEYHIGADAMRKLISRMALMCDEAFFVVKSSLILTSVSLFCCLVLLLAAGKFSADTYKIYRLAEEFFRLPQALLFIAAIGSVILEEQVKKDT
jgi:hypothetical protein